MRIPIVKTHKYKNYNIEIDPTGEILILYDSKDNKVGTLAFEEMIDFLTGALMLNKRTEPRTPLSLRIRYQTDEGKWYESITDTVGGGGLFIETRTPLEKGTPVKVELALPGKKTGPIQAEGVVAWTREKFERILHFPGMGVQFTHVSPEDKKELVSEINLLNRLRGAQVDMTQKD